MKDCIIKELIDLFDRIGIQTPSNFDDIVEFINDNIDDDCNKESIAFNFKQWVENDNGQRMTTQKLKIAIDSESINIYREMGLDEDPLQIVYWHEDEWLEDPETVVPAILQAVNLFYWDQVQLLKILGFDEYIL